VAASGGMTFVPRYIKIDRLVQKLFVYRRVQDRDKHTDMICIRYVCLSLYNVGRLAEAEQV
jgi:hypothetical protein